MINRYCILAFLVLTTLLTAKGQSSIKGRVVDEKTQKGIAGATIKANHSLILATTDSEGAFVFSLKTYDTVWISSVGYKAKKLAIKREQKNVLVSLMPESVMIEEVQISTGYYSLPKERATGSFDFIDSKTLQRNTSSAILDRLEDIAPSLQFDKRKIGQMNSDNNRTAMRLRGTNTIYADGSPLIILDNFPYDGDINGLNPNDIESITMLKDAAATSIWGARASNGVIVLTSKKGKGDQPLTVSLNAVNSFSPRPDLTYGKDFINAKDYIDLEKVFFEKGIYDARYSDASKSPLSPVVTWLYQHRNNKISDTDLDQRLRSAAQIDLRDEAKRYLYRSSFLQQYNVNMRGGSSDFSYFFSGGWDGQRLHDIGNSQKRTTFSSSVSYYPISQLKFDFGYGFIANNNVANTVDFRNFDYLYPYMSLKQEDGNAAVLRDYNLEYVGEAPTSGLLDWNYRPLDELNLQSKRSGMNENRWSLAINYGIVKGIRLSLNLQSLMASTNYRNLEKKDAYYVRNLVNRYTQADGSRVFPYGDILSQSRQQLTSKSGRLQLDVDRQFGSHRVVFLSGMEQREVVTKLDDYTLYGYNDELLTSQMILDYTKVYPLRPQSSGRIPFPMSTLKENIDRYLSYYANLGYDWKSKYLLSGSVRWDASNLFGVNTNQKGIPLWSVGLAWNMGDENFFKNDVVQQLKWRVSYGKNGNIDRSMTAYPTVSYSVNSSTNLQQALVTSPGNQNLRWEKVATLNVGMDFRIKGKFRGSVDYYRKKSDDLIGIDLIDPTVYYGGSQAKLKRNYAKMETAGMDLTLGYGEIGSRIKWSNEFWLSKTSNRVTDYYGDNTITVMGYTTGMDKRPIKDKSLDALYSLPWFGLDHTTGNPLVINDGVRNTEYTKYINSLSMNDLVNHGSSVPIWTGAWRNNFRWKDLTLSFNIAFKLGYYFRRNSVEYSLLMTNGKGMHEDYLNRWKQAGDEAVTNVPSNPFANIANRDIVYTQSEILAEKGDHIRLRDIRLDYSLSKLLHNRFKIKDLSIYGYLNNVGILWRKNKLGLDPDYPSASYYLSPRIFSLGIKMSY
ncbi:SusC/RagA family TonB-linked outer membrane protein [Sphingobacterium multivorum]|uniref:SusC/RagA family TonB-linked outer membrane protein n=1 Tax=Sphingobacterium multivorum TaxID=28454 RepID=UPI0028A208DA|nr:SusC/RagA family TonB-linked outer membrane protein [Sphingobacterium multivorum]